MQIIMICKYKTEQEEGEWGLGLGESDRQLEGRRQQRTRKKGKR